MKKKIGRTHGSSMAFKKVLGQAPDNQNRAAGQPKDGDNLVENDTMGSQQPIVPQHLAPQQPQKTRGVRKHKGCSACGQKRKRR